MNSIISYIDFKFCHQASNFGSGFASITATQYSSGTYLIDPDVEVKVDFGGIWTQNMKTDGIPQRMQTTHTTQHLNEKEN